LITSSTFSIQSKPKVLVSILNWNAPESTVKTVRSVLLSTYDNFNIVLLDNNSCDDSVRTLKHLFPAIELIQNKKNLGYAGAHKIAANLAIKEGFDLLWILNNDVELMPDTLETLVSSYQMKGPALYGSITLNQDRSTIGSAGGVPINHEYSIDPSTCLNSYNGKNVNEVLVPEEAVTYVDGTSFLIPILLIKKYGFMDTRFFLYGEETEYCYRLRRQHAIQSILVPSSKVIHVGGGSFQIHEKLKWIRSYYATRNNNIVLNKYLFTENSNRLTVRNVKKYCAFFLKHFFLIAREKKDGVYWANYYKELGDFHSILKLKGKYLSPEKFLN
jgi:GT2 family glycosyltransferase